MEVSGRATHRLHFSYDFGQSENMIDNLRLESAENSAENPDELHDLGVEMIHLGRFSPNKDIPGGYLDHR